MIETQMQYDIFSYIQEYDRFASNFQNFECKEERDYYLAKYSTIDAMNTPIGKPESLIEKSCKISKPSFEKWIEKRKDQQLIDNGITFL